MVTPAGPAVEVHRDQGRRPRHDDVCFFGKFAFQRFQHRLAHFHAASRQLPAGNVGMAHQQNGVRLRVMDETAHAQRHRTPQQKIEMKQPRRQAGTFVSMRNGGRIGTVHFTFRFL